MSKTILNKDAVFAQLPKEWPDDFLPSICSEIAKSNAKIVILDDDPTGTQTVHGIPVLTTWDIDSLKKEIKIQTSAFFILTNSRGLTKDEACKLAKEVGSNLKTASKGTGKKLTIISRSDSTLRGHFPHEVDEVAKAFGNADLPYLICPFFLEGGRFTINDIHYVLEGSNLVPSAETSYAKDATFGFKNSNLTQWVEEKTTGKISAEHVISVTLDDIRQGGPEKVMETLIKVPNYSACIVNATSYRDMEVFVTGLLAAQTKGKQFLFRTAASFVRVMAGIEPRKELLSKKELTSDTSTGGLFIVGSYVPKTTTQVKTLMEKTNIHPLRINVEKILDTALCEKEIAEIITHVNKALQKGQDTLIYTSRNLITGNDPDTSLKIGQTVSSSLIKIVKGLDCQPRYIVAKGGITSSDIATKGLMVKRALVLGQALPGIPVWKIGAESLYPDMSYIIFPGNVGDDHALVSIQIKLSN